MCKSLSICQHRKVQEFGQRLLSMNEENEENEENKELKQRLWLCTSEHFLVHIIVLALSIGK